MNVLRRISLVGVIALLAVVIGAPLAHADALDGTLDDGWNWSTTQQYNYCYNESDNPFVRQCDATSIGEVNFRITVSLYGRSARVKTSWTTPYDGRRLKVYSFVECRKDEKWDDSCGFTHGPYQESFSYWSDIDETFDEENNLEKDGKYFFNLHYRVEIEDAPSTATEPVVMNLGTSYRFKCSRGATPSDCQFSGKS